MKQATAPAKSIDELRRRLPAVLHLETVIGRGQTFYLWRVSQGDRRSELLGYRGPARKGHNC